MAMDTAYRAEVRSNWTLLDETYIPRWISPPAGRGVWWWRNDIWCFFNRNTLFRVRNQTSTYVKRQSNPITGLERPWGFQEIEAPRFQDNRHMKVVGLSALRTGRLHPQEIFLVLISVRGWVNQGHSAAGRITSMNNFSDTIGNRTHDLPACSPEP